MNLIFKDQNTGVALYNPEGQLLAVIKPCETPPTGKDFRSVIETIIKDHEGIDDAVLTDQKEFCPTEENRIHFTVHTYRDGSDDEEYEEYNLKAVTIY